MSSYGQATPAHVTGTLHDPDRLLVASVAVVNTRPDLIQAARASFDEGQMTCMVEIWWWRPTTPEERSTAAKGAVEALKGWLGVDAGSWKFKAKNAKLVQPSSMPWEGQPDPEEQDLPWSAWR